MGDRANNLQRAVASYHEALRIFTPEAAPLDYARTQNNLGEAYRSLPTGDREANVQRAIASFEEALRLHPAFPVAYFNRGITYAILGQHERAMADFDEALRLDPAYTEAYLITGKLLDNQGKYSEALSYFEKAAELDLQYAAMAQERMDEAIRRAATQVPLHETLEPESEMILIPAGPFLMGSPRRDGMRTDVEPEQFEMNIYGYTIGKYPVTVGEYRTFIESGGYQQPRWWTQSGWAWRSRENKNVPRYWNDEVFSGEDSLPIVGISWYEAYAYTRWLSETTGQNYRLPTEAEWEKAAKGTDGRKYPWGNEFDPGRCNVEGQVNHIAPVNTYPNGISPYGVFDMVGNVWEWCLSSWDDKYKHPENNDPDGDQRRVIRGGSWSTPSSVATTTHRTMLLPFVSSPEVGFRVVMLLQ
jgi:formylglycine-generating enzyme required for sulfatase activity